MEALLNKGFQESLTENDEDLERKIQAELDNYEYQEGNSIINQSLAQNDKSILEKDENIEDLDAWKEIQEFKKENEKMFEKFARNIKNLKEITEGFREEGGGGENSTQLVLADENLINEKKKLEDEYNDDMKEDEEKTYNNEEEQETNNNEQETNDNENQLRNIENVENELISKNDEAYNKDKEEQRTYKKEESRKNIEKHEIKNKEQEHPKKQELTKNNKNKEQEHAKVESTMMKNNEQEHPKMSQQELKSKEELNKATRNINSKTNNNKKSMTKRDSELKTTREKEKKSQEAIENLFSMKKKKETNLDLTKQEESRINQEYEWFRMEKEDLYSQKYEEACILRDFSLKSYIIPYKICEKSSNFREISLNFAEKLVFLQMSAKVEIPSVLTPNEKTLLPRNSKQICLLNLKKIVNQRKAYSSNNNKSNKKIMENSLFEKSKEISKPPVIFNIKQPKTQIITTEFSLFMNKILKNLDILVKSLPNSLLASLQKLKTTKSPYIDNDINIQPPFPPLPPELKNRSINDFLTKLNKKQQESLKSLELKLENLKDLNGLETVPKLRSLVLSMNEIQKIQRENLNNFEQLVFLDLSQNAIVDYSSVNGLKNLRTLNLEMNRIEKISNLSNCPFLESLNLNKNHIQTLENLSSTPSLTKLFLYQNLIEKLQGLNNLIALEELDLGRNKLKSLENIENLISLRKLVLYNNEISSIPHALRLPLLTELFLNNNSLLSINSLVFLPCLTLLNIEGNNITGLEEGKLVFWPNVRVLRVGFNKIGSFLGVFRMLCGVNRNHLNLENLEYSENPFISEVSNETKQFFEMKLGELCQNLREINGETVNMRKHREKNDRNCEINRDLGVFGIISQEFGFINQMEARKIKPSPFLKTNEFREKRAFLGYEHLKLIVGEKQRTNMNNSLFYRKDEFELNFNVKIHKIQRFFKIKIREIRKKREFYAENTGKIIKIQSLYRGWRLRRRFNNMSNKTKAKSISAVKIQKVFKGFLLRKRKKTLFAGIKYHDGEELQEVDTDFFLNSKGFDVDFSLKVPEFLLNNNENYSENPQKTEIKKVEDIGGSNRKKLPPIENPGMFQKVEQSLSEISSISSRKSVKTRVLPKIREEKKAEEIMQAWGLKKVELRETLAYKLEKERKRKEDKNKKSLTAEERFAKFARSVKK